MKIRAPKKLIEVALPLDDINKEAAREKSIRHGHPSTLHLWWARRPLAAARAVLFAQLVNDPGGTRGWDSRKGITKKLAAERRERLFDIIRRLVVWENSNDEALLEEAREEIRRSWRETCEMNRGAPGFDPEVLPAFHDPFAGGGAIPLEAQRLGLEAHASDLNPVAVMINKAMIEIPPRFAGRAPVGPLPPGEAPVLPRNQDSSLVSRHSSLAAGDWPAATGLAEDVRRYGLWMRDEAKKRIGHLYPAVEVTAEMAKARPDLAPYKNQKLTVIAWLWARTVPSPHPSFSHVRIPLVSSFVLSSKKGKEVWVEPIVEGDTYRFEIRTGKPQEGAEMGTTQGKRKAFRCLLSGMPMDYDYIREQGKTTGLESRLMAIVCEGDRGRVYLPPNAEQEHIATSQQPTWRPEAKLPDNPRDFKTPNYGLTSFGSLFTDRQLVALNTFSDLVQEARAKILVDAAKGGFPSDDRPLADGGNGPRAYADAVAVYLAFVLDKAANYWSSICTWHVKAEKLKSTFGRQAIPMAWDYTECNPLGNSSGNWAGHLELTVKSVRNSPAIGNGYSFQADAQSQAVSEEKVVSTDPPYYDNIGYADLSDFFYAWMRRSLRDLFPSLFSTMAVPKAEELVATPYRHGGVAEAEAFFLDGMTATMHNLAVRAHPAFPVTIYYAFKQSETNDAGTSNAGWETFLEALIRAGFVITGTWPMSTEQTTGLKTYDNVLASSIVLVCRKRDEDAPETERRAFLDELKETMADALRDMKGLDGEASPIAPVDLAQAAIGPGMEVYSKYSIVRNADGSRMPVHDAIQEINRLLDGDDDFDAATRFCRDLFASRAWGEGPFGEADVLARAKGTTVDHVRDAGVLSSAGGKVRLLRYEEYPEDYDPAEDRNRPAWEACHHLVRVLRTQGTTEAGKLLARMPEAGEAARALAYSLYVLCERKGLAQDAGAYNELVTSWSDILSAAAEYRATIPEQGTLGL